MLYTKPCPIFPSKTANAWEQIPKTCLKPTQAIHLKHEAGGKVLQMPALNSESERCEPWRVLLASAVYTLLQLPRKTQPQPPSPQKPWPMCSQAFLHGADVNRLPLPRALRASVLPHPLTQSARKKSVPCASAGPGSFCHCGDSRPHGLLAVLSQKGFTTSAAWASC